MSEAFKPPERSFIQKRRAGEEVDPLIQKEAQISMAMLVLLLVDFSLTKHSARDRIRATDMLEELLKNTAPRSSYSERLFENCANYMEDR